MDFDLQGHRGARGLLPENTLPGFALALDLGVTTLELDTVISADGEVVVSHEPWMSHEMCSHPDGRPVLSREERKLNLYRMDYAEIATFDSGIRGHPRFPRQRPTPSHKPRLKDVFELAESHTTGKGPIRYNIETKSREAWMGRYCPPPTEFVERLWEVIDQAGVADRTVIQSFDVRTLQAARELKLPVRLSLLVERSVRQALHSGLRYFRSGVANLGFLPDVYSPEHHLVTPETIRLAHDQGIRIVPWTVNDSRRMIHLIRMGVDGLITDYPDIGMEVVRSLRD